MSMSMRFRNPSVLGAVTGCFFTTLLYFVFFRSPLLGRGVDTGENLVREPFFLGEEVNPVGAGSSAARNSAQEAHYRSPAGQRGAFMRKMLLQVIATSRGNLNIAQHKVNTSWGQDSVDWRLALATKDPNKLKVNDRSRFLVATECQEFPDSEYLSPVQLFCLLEAVLNSPHSQYRWFLFAQDMGVGGTVYISVNQLERVLAELDPDVVTYMGRPHTSNGYCEGKSGILLSQRALKEVVPHLQSCLDDERANTTGVGDEVLGACFESKLQKTCHQWHEPSSVEYFVNDFHSISTISMVEWRESHLHFLTVFPVRTVRDMQALHAVDLTRELLYHRNQVSTLSQELSSSPLCRLQTLDLELEPPQRSSEVKAWSVANPNSTYFSDRLEPREWYDGELKMELETVARRGLMQVNKQNGTSFKFRRVLYSFFRYLGTDGREVMIDVETQSRRVIKLHVIRPFLLTPILLEDAGIEAIKKTIDFVVPLSNVRGRFAEFMKTYEDLCLKVDENCRLNLVVYGNKDLDIIKSNLSVYKASYPKAQFNLIPGEGKFSRGRALHAGISVLPKSALAFTCDVDMTIDRGFLNRCRRNAIEGRRVYYPEVFKYYDMAYVYRFEPKPLFGYDISRKHGHWCTYGYGMLCIYKSDYDTIGGYDTTIEGWGGEDIQLIDNVIERGFEVMRAPDPALSHRYHPKVCSTKLTKAQYSQCVSSRNEDIADRRRLADYIYYLENKCNIKKKIWD